MPKPNTVNVLFAVTYVKDDDPDNYGFVVDTTTPAMRGNVPWTTRLQEEADAKVAEVQNTLPGWTCQVVRFDPFQSLPQPLAFDATLIAQRDDALNLAEQRRILVESLTAQRDEARASVTDVAAQVREAKRVHQADLDLCSREWNEEADARGWCDEYDEGMRSLSRKLVGHLTFRSRDYDVTTRYTFDITHRVTATSSDDAEGDELGNPQLIDKLAHAVRHGEYESESPRAELAD